MITKQLISFLVGVSRDHERSRQLILENSEEGSAALKDAVTQILLLAATQYVDWDEVSQFFCTDNNTTTGSL